MLCSQAYRKRFLFEKIGSQGRQQQTLNLMTDKHIKEFQEMYTRNFGVVLTDAEALEELLALLSLVKATYKPMSESQFVRLQQRRRQTGDLQD